MKIELRKIKDEFYRDKSSLKEILHKEPNKERGYGYIYVPIKGYNFAIPLRSHITHDNGFVLTTPPNSRGYGGLDYSKAIIVSADYLGDVFVIDNKQFGKIYRNSKTIITEFTQYVENYIAYRTNDQLDSTLKDAYSRAYRYSTMKNYHEELGIRWGNFCEDLMYAP